jgi:hypothetical protein
MQTGPLANFGFVEKEPIFRNYPCQLVYLSMRYGVDWHWSGKASCCGCLWDIQQNHRTALEPKSITAPVFAGSKPAVCECLEISRIWMNLETFPSHAFANHIYSSIKSDDSPVWDTPMIRIVWNTPVPRSQRTKRGRHTPTLLLCFLSAQGW